MSTQIDRPAIQAFIRAKLIELIELSCEHGIDIQSLMNEALHHCDPESG
jgi:hypothetical protein